MVEKETPEDWNPGPAGYEPNGAHTTALENARNLARHVIGRRQDRGSRASALQLGGAGWPSVEEYSNSTTAIGSVVSGSGGWIRAVLGPRTEGGPSTRGRALDTRAGDPLG